MNSECYYYAALRQMLLLGTSAVCVLNICCFCYNFCVFFRALHLGNHPLLIP